MSWNVALLWLRRFIHFTAVAHSDDEPLTATIEYFVPCCPLYFHAAPLAVA